LRSSRRSSFRSWRMKPRAASAARPMTKPRPSCERRTESAACAAAVPAARDSSATRRASGKGRYHTLAIGNRTAECREACGTGHRPKHGVRR
jgi:hypothetical protein